MTRPRDLIASANSWVRERLPSTRKPIDPALAGIVLMRVSILRSLALSLRFRGWFLVARGTRIKIGSGSRVQFGPRSFLFVGFRLETPTAALVQLGRRATLVVEGTAQINRGVRMFINDGARLEMYDGSIIGDHATVTCFQRIVFGRGGGISWYSNVTDTSAHQMIIDGKKTQMTAPVILGDRVMVGSFVTVLAGVTLGDGSVVAAGSVVTKDVPPHSLVAGNPARVLSEDVEWLA
jgi:acetyltransferase-like isoleucine patch superfamily enzyme